MRKLFLFLVLLTAFWPPVRYRLVSLYALATLHPEALTRVVRTAPEAPLARTAGWVLERLAWEGAQSAASDSAYLAFTTRFPESPLAPLALETATRLQHQQGTVPLHTLATQDAVAFEITGQSIDQAHLRLRRQARWPVRITLPVGTQLLADGNAQNLILTAPVSVELRDTTWHSVSLPVACLNRERPVPGPRDTFTLAAPPPPGQSPALDEAMQALHQAQAPFPVIQAAVWILQNPDLAYPALLTSLRGGRMGAPRITPTVTARALFLLDQHELVSPHTLRLWPALLADARNVENAGLQAWLFESVRTL